MIIFDLDGTLADFSHRQYFVDPLKDHPDYFRHPCETCKDGSHHKIDPQYHKVTGKEWKPDWKAFFEACDQDKPIDPTLNVLWSLNYANKIEIWSGRCESVRDKTEQWLHDQLGELFDFTLKMRPVGDYTPDDELKEGWLNERCADLITAGLKGEMPINHDIEYVFDDRPKVVRMWKRRGIFVFNCQQNDEEF